MKAQRNIARFGMILALLFWVVDSFIDAQLSSEGITFLESVLEPDAEEIWIRSFVILLFLIFSVYTERLLRIINTMSRELKQYHENLEYTVAELHMETGERKLAIEELEKLAETDPLTSLINRRKFQILLNYEVERSERYLSNLSLIMCDVDHLNKINNQFGYDAGDKTLQSFTEIISRNIREVDIFSRWGGEEFMILMPNTNINNAYIAAEKLRKIIENASIKTIGSMTVSFGVVHFNTHDTTESFIKRADEALYKAKEKGRNAVVRSG